jgi:hypothetical protein
MDLVYKDDCRALLIEKKRGILDRVEFFRNSNKLVFQIIRKRDRD